MNRRRRMAGRQSASGFKWVVIAGLLAWFGWNYFSSGGSSGTPDAPRDSGEIAAGATASYAQRGTLDNWPPLDGAAAGAAASLATVNYYLVLDGSGSMGDGSCSVEQTKLKEAVLALNRFLDAVPAEANVGLAVFDRAGLSPRVPLGLGNRDELRAALARVRADGKTPLKSALELGYQELTAQAQRQLGYGEYHLVMVTDGQPDPRSQTPEPVVDRVLAESPVVLHTVGFCIGTDHVLNQPGRSYYVAADSPDELLRGLDAVLAEAPQFDLDRFAN